ncbi:MAG: ABC transporter permease subunit [Gordonia sp. (in: high G+C Gram-positive bacteria)]
MTGRRKASRWALTATVSVVLLVLWEVAADLWLSDKGVLGAPSEVLRSLVTDWPLYWSNFEVTAWIAVRGWLWGNLAAIIIAFVFVQVPILESIFLRLAVTLFCLPLVAVNPILQLTFDVDRAKVILAALSVFFTTLVGGILGLRSADAGTLTLIRAWGGGGLAATRYVRTPSSVPAMLTGLQIGVPAAVLGAIFGEFLGAKSGLGVLLINGLMSLDLARVWSVAVLVTVMAAIPYVLIGVVRDRLAPWSATISTAAAQRTARGPRYLHAVTGAFWIAVSVVVILIAWSGYLKAFDVSPYVGKSPKVVWDYLFTGDLGAQNRVTVFDALRATMVHSLVGYIAGMAVGVGCASAFVTFPLLERILTPVTVALRSVPIIVLIPVLILALGRGLAGVIAIAAIVTFFPALANTQNGLKRVPPDAMILMRSYSASVWTSLWRVQLPYALPSIFASARIAAPTAVLAATLAEWLATGDGLGHQIVNAQAHADYTGLWAGAAVLTGVSLIFYGCVTATEQVILRRYSPASRY